MITQMHVIPILSEHFTHPVHGGISVHISDPDTGMHIVMIVPYTDTILIQRFFLLKGCTVFHQVCMIFVIPEQRFMDNNEITAVTRSFSDHINRGVNCRHNTGTFLSEITVQI